MAKDTLPKAHIIILERREKSAIEDKIGHREDWTGKKGDKVNNIVTYYSKEDK